MANVIYAAGGLIILHTAQCQPKDSTSIIVTNLLSIAVSTIAFWGCGFAFAVGDPSSSNFYLSHTKFFLIDASISDFERFVPEVCLTSLIIVLVNSGFVSRLRHWIYPFVAILVSGFTYPCVRHWTSSDDGWLAKGIEYSDGAQVKYRDKYGAGYLHVFAGSASLIGTILLSARKERQKKNFPPLDGQITPLMLVGGTLAFGGLMSKNFGTSQGFVNNILAAHASALVAYGFKRLELRGNISGTKAFLNGAIAGLVSVSCDPDTYHSYGGFVIGVVGGLAFVFWNFILHSLHIDDPTQTVSVNLGCGLWALLAGPLFRSRGILYNGSTVNFRDFGWNLLGGVAIFVWSGISLFILLIVLVLFKVAKNNDIRVSEAGMDIIEHNEPAYPDHDSYSHIKTDGLSNIFMDRLTSKNDFINDSSYIPKLESDGIRNPRELYFQMS
ncbi:putative ammonium transporter 1 isoform X2 [Hydra vulgaris]|uniref:putative ammonium transporter 1 isoform X2 n=1 Tax=Hydra vulgaris TaxID=6087 RepID=UPI001F5E6464|nr:putative ammonium transporter 1 isoform X2 [Hydra vulgaris]